MKEFTLAQLSERLIEKIVKEQNLSQANLYSPTRKINDKRLALYLKCDFMKKRTNIKFNQSLSTTCYFNWEQRALMSFPVPVVPTFTKVHDIVFGSLKYESMKN